MDYLESQLRQLKKADPGAPFCRESKKRILYQIEHRQNEQWFVAFLRKIEQVIPQSEFLTQARIRLMARIATPRFSFAWIFSFKKLAVSTLIMILAVTSTLFFVDGRQVVNASEDTYLEVITGSVTIKRADRLMWDKVGMMTDLSAGDLIKVGLSGSAVVHFFDDSELRLSENSVLLLDKIEPSPAFARQGIINVTLSQGRAWIQTLNVDDSFAGLSLVTRDVSIKMLNGAADVTTGLYSPTKVLAFNNGITLQQLQMGSLDVVATATLSENQMTELSGAAGNRIPRFSVDPLGEANRTDEWVQTNLQKDRDHLAFLREREFNSLQMAVGVLPGQVLYPIKLAKERLKLAFSFGDDNLTEAQIDIANKRLNEAIVLLGQNKRSKALEALMAYQSITRNLVENATKEGGVRGEISQRIITKNQKALVASLPNDPPIRLVTEALNQTEEMIAENPIEREQVRLKNSAERLTQIFSLVTVGDYAAAKEALAEHQVAAIDILDHIAAIADSEEQKALLVTVLELRQTEAQLLNDIVAFMEGKNLDTQLMAMLEQANASSEGVVSDTMAFIDSFAPDFVYHKPQPAPDAKVQAFADRLAIYKTAQGQKNQLARLFREQPMLTRDIHFLQEVQTHLETGTQSLMDTYILQAQNYERTLKHKAVKRKIDQTKKLRN